MFGVLYVAVDVAASDWTDEKEVGKPCISASSITIHSLYLGGEYASMYSGVCTCSQTLSRSRVQMNVHTDCIACLFFY